MPTISYGTTFGGIPVKSNKNNYEQWCKEMGFGGGLASITTTFEFVFGILYWCKGYDDQAYKWCDVYDGYWKNTTLDGSHQVIKVARIEKLSCMKGIIVI